jgi:heat shock protein HtpX
MGHQDFHRLIISNKRKTIILVVTFCCFVPLVAAILVPLFVTFLAGGTWLRSIVATHPGLSVIDLSLVIGGIAWIYCCIFCVLMYRNGDQAVLRSLQAKRIRHEDDPELFNCVDEMAIAAGIPMPRVFRIDDAAANALATGRDPEHASIVVTTGLREMLTRDELEGVIAHEMSHIRNYDTRLMLMTSVLVGAVDGLCAYCAAWAVHLIPDWNLTPEDKEERSYWLVYVAFIATIISLTVWWLGPLIVFEIAVALLGILALAPLSAHVIQFAVSREREYLADASAVDLARDPQSLASALFKIDHHRHQLRAVSGATAHLFIANPLPRFRRLGRTVFASHPPLKERIRRLVEMSA